MSAPREVRPEIRVDTLVIGAGVIGSALAMHLARLGLGSVAEGDGSLRVIDFDLEGPLSSSELNAGGVRATWIQPINILMSKLTIDYFASVASDVGYRDVGYLWLHAPGRLEIAVKARERQVAAGWPVDVLDVAELTRRFPLIDKTEGVAGACFAPRDGLVNPNLLKNHFREQARARGARFDDRRLVRGAVREGSDWLVTVEAFPVALDVDQRRDVLTGRVKGSELGAEIVRYRARRVVNCSGAWAAEVAGVLGYKSPSHAMRRQVCIFDCKEADLSHYGMIVDTSGVYFHPEGGNGLAGFASNDEPHGYNFDYDGEKFFMELIWPALYERSSAFERLRHLTGWGGLYEVSPDECGIVGSVAGSPGLFESHSFSGHGVMHSFSAGLALAEKIVKGRYETFDAEPLSAARFDGGTLLRETLVI